MGVGTGIVRLMGDCGVGGVGHLMGFVESMACTLEDDRVATLLDPSSIALVWARGRRVESNGVGRTG